MDSKTLQNIIMWGSLGLLAYYVYTRYISPSTVVVPSNEPAALPAPMVSASTGQPVPETLPLALTIPYMRGSYTS